MAVLVSSHSRRVDVHNFTKIKYIYSRILKKEKHAHFAAEANLRRILTYYLHQLHGLPKQIKLIKLNLRINLRMLAHRSSAEHRAQEHACVPLKAE